jgi:hypothetical protein
MRGCAIEISFVDRSLQRRCNSDQLGGKSWGDRWPLLRRRLAALAAAEVLADLDGVPGRWYEIAATGCERFAFQLWPGYHLVLDPADDPLPRTADGHPDPRSIARVTVVGIEVSR